MYGISSDSHGNISASGKGVELVRLLSLKHALNLEIRTGMSHSRGSIMNIARETIGSPKRTKKGVLADLEKFIKKNYPTS